MLTWELRAREILNTPSRRLILTVLLALIVARCGWLNPSVSDGEVHFNVSITLLALVGVEMIRLMPQGGRLNTFLLGTLATWFLFLPLIDLVNFNDSGAVAGYDMTQALYLNYLRLALLIPSTIAGVMTLGFALLVQRAWQRFEQVNAERRAAREATNTGDDDTEAPIVPPLQEDQAEQPASRAPNPDS